MRSVDSSSKKEFLSTVDRVEGPPVSGKDTVNLDEEVFISPPSGRPKGSQQEGFRQEERWL